MAEIAPADTGNLIRPSPGSARWWNLPFAAFVASIMLAGLGWARDSSPVPTSVAGSGAAIRFTLPGESIHVHTAPSLQALEKERRGAAIDLLGATLRVDSIPDGANYFNGAFLGPAGTRVLPRSPPDHPLSGPITVVQDDEFTHPYAGPAGQPDGEDVLIRFHQTGWRHEASLGNAVYMTLDHGGEDPSDTQKVYGEPDRTARGLVGGKVAGRRIGVMYLVTGPADEAVELRWSFTEDGGRKLIHTVVSGPPFFPHGDPAILADGSVIVLGFGGRDLFKAVSTDGGRTFTSTLLKEGPEGRALAEPILLRPASDEFVILARVDDEPGLNAFATTSRDLVATTPWVDSGFPAGRNPMAGLDAWGRSWIYVAGRRGSPVEGHEHHLLVAEVDGEALFASGGALASPPTLRVVAEGKNGLIGYLTIARLNDGRFVGHLADGESPTGSARPSSSRIVRLSSPGTEPVPSIRGPRMAQLSLASDLGGLEVTGSGAEVLVQRVATPAQMLPYLTNRPLESLRLASPANGSGRRVRRVLRDRSVIARLLGRPLQLSAALSGRMPGYLRFTITADYGQGGRDASGQQIATAERDSRQPAIFGGLTFVGVVLPSPPLPDRWGDGPSLTIELLSNGYGDVDAVLHELVINRP